jgi:hypothetical protein
MQKWCCRDIILHSPFCRAWPGVLCRLGEDFTHATLQSDGMPQSHSLGKGDMWLVTLAMTAAQDV